MFIKEGEACKKRYIIERVRDVRGYLRKGNADQEVICFKKRAGKNKGEWKTRISERNHVQEERLKGKREQSYFGGVFFLMHEKKGSPCMFF